MKALNYYGHRNIIKRYLRVPNRLLKHCQWEHGWSTLDRVIASDVANDRLMLVFSQRRRELHEAHKRRIGADYPVFVLGAPFALYRYRRNLRPLPNSVGTIAFPAHSRKYTKSVYDVAAYCDALGSLPNTFKPITVCLHFRNLEQSQEFQSRGFQVVTAGPMHDHRFVSRFYGLLRSHRFATSNTIGSHVLYAVDLGLPFFLHGPTKTTVKTNASKLPELPPEFTTAQFPEAIKATKLFSTGPVDAITTEQLHYVQEEIGLTSAAVPDYLRSQIMDFAHTRHHP